MIVSPISNHPGHIIGIGTLWEDNSLVTGSVGAGTLTYVGTNAVSVWSTDWGCVGTPPMEFDGGDGTAGGHWDEVCHMKLEIRSSRILSHRHSMYVGLHG